MRHQFCPTGSFSFVPVALLVASLGFLSGCIDTSTPRSSTAAEYCEDKAATDCRKYWQCYGLLQRNEVAARLAAMGLSLGNSEQECTTNLRAPCKVTPPCAPGLVFQEMNAASCVDALASLTCDQLQRTQSASAPQCDRVCTPQTL